MIVFYLIVFDFFLLFYLQNLVLIVVSVGILFSIIFHVGVKEKPVTHEMEESLTQKSCQKMKKTTWTAWLKEVQFWQVCNGTVLAIATSLPRLFFMRNF